MKFLAFVIFLTSVIFSCKKDNATAACAIPAIVPFQPYSDPVWHPNGQLLGFNHTPLVSISASGSAPCTWYYYAVNRDSAGFYLMNKDGTGFKRVTNFRLSAPAWSPDGKWLAFSLGPNIYKMPFDGTTFDTNLIVQLTTNGGNFFPGWTANSDTIFYDSNVGTNGQGYFIWKMASDGSGKTGIPNTGRQPFVGSDNRVYYVGLQSEIYSINKDGSDQLQISYKQKNGVRRSPKYYQGRAFFQDIGLFSTSVVEYGTKELAKSCVTYDISVRGEIVYSKMDYDIAKYTKQIGTLWIMNADGSNNRRLTFNNF